jgi:hypothetical protein
VRAARTGLAMVRVGLWRRRALVRKRADGIAGAAWGDWAQRRSSAPSQALVVKRPRTDTLTLAAAHDEDEALCAPRVVLPRRTTATTEGDDDEEGEEDEGEEKAETSRALMSEDDDDTAVADKENGRGQAVPSRAASVTPTTTALAALAVTRPRPVLGMRRLSARPMTPDTLRGDGGAPGGLGPRRRLTHVSAATPYPAQVGACTRARRLRGRGAVCRRTSFAAFCPSPSRCPCLATSHTVCGRRVGARARVRLKLTPLRMRSACCTCAHHSQRQESQTAQGPAQARAVLARRRGRARPVRP